MTTSTRTDCQTKWTSNSRFAIAALWFSKWIFVLTLATIILPSLAQAQDSVNEGRNALSKKTYPWYDAESDNVRRVDLESRPQPRSSNRNDIPTYQPKGSKVEPWDWSGNWAGGAPAGGGNTGSAFAGGISALMWALLITLILVTVGVLIWAVARMGSNPEDEDEDLPAPRSMQESIKQLPFDLAASNGDFRQQAQEFYRNGDYRNAITYLFSHVLVSLDQKGLIRLRKGKTNRQYLRELRQHRPLANYYQHVMVPFEATFFGDHELGQREFESCWNQLDQFQSGVKNTSQVTNA